MKNDCVWLGTALALLLLSGGLGVTAAQEGDGLGYQGITEPVADAILSFPVSGVIDARPVGEGESVAKGDVLCALDHTTERLEIQRRKVLLETAAQDLKRTERLFERTGSVSEEELDEKRATLRVAETELAMAEAAVERRVIMAPFAGTVTDHYGLGIGEGAEILAPVVRLVDTRQVRFVANVPATEAGSLSAGASVVLQVGAVALEGVVTFVSPVIDPSSGLVTVKARFDNAEGQVRPGAAGSMRKKR